MIPVKSSHYLSVAGNPSAFASPMHSYECWASGLPAVSSQWTAGYLWFALIFLFLILGWSLFLMDREPLTV